MGGSPYGFGFSFPCIVFLGENNEFSIIFVNFHTIYNLWLQHPYIYPVTDIGVLAQKPFVFVVEPFHKNGTLKDLIYKVHVWNIYIGIFLA